MDLHTFGTIYAFIFGICIGSFLNVVILRAFSGESIVLPPSKCPKCNHKLAWYDNIPLLSYLLLRGKCRYCKEKISPQYPIVEFFTGLIFSALFFKFGLTLKTLFLIIASCLGIVMTVSDIKEKVIFDTHAYILAIVGLIYNFFNFGQINNTRIHLYLAGFDISIYQTFIHALLGLIFGAIIMELMARIPQIFIKRRAFGEGDSYIAGALGAFFGISNVIIIFLLSIFVWGIAIIPIFLYKWIKEKNYKLVSALILFFIATGLFALGQYFDTFTSNLFFWFSYLLVASIGLYVCKLIFKSIKENSAPMVIPFGPALLFGALLVMFLF